MQNFIFNVANQTFKAFKEMYLITFYHCSTYCYTLYPDKDFMMKAHFHATPATTTFTTNTIRKYLFI